MTPGDFRQGFPEFASTSDYPDSMIQFWLDWAPKLLNESRWGEVFDLGVSLFTAHNISIEKRNLNAVVKGGVPGSSSMVMTASAVDKVSVSYDASAGLDPADGQWNLTNYGTRLIQILKMMGAGPLTIEGGSCTGVAGAWQGPWQGLFPNPSG